MNILILGDTETAGEWIITQTLVEKLSKDNKYKFYLVAYGKNKHYIQTELFEKVILLDKTSLKPPFRYYRQIFQEFIFAFRKLTQLRKLATIESVAATNEYLLFLASFFVFPRAKKIFNLQGIRHAQGTPAAKFNFYLFLVRSLERFAWLISQKLVVPSEAAKKAAKKELGFFSIIKDIKVIPNIIPDFFIMKYRDKELKNFKKKLELPNNSKIIIYSGRIDKVKGLENLVKAFILLRRKVDNVFLAIAYIDVKTDNKLYADLVRIIKQNRLDTYVHWIRNLPRKKLPLFYQSADCAVFPSFSEMDSLALREVLASNTPVFSTATGNAGKFLSQIDNFFILRKNSAAEISQVLGNFFRKSPNWKKKIKREITTIMQSEFSANHKQSVIAYANLFR